MKIIQKIWAFFGVLGVIVAEPRYLAQEAHHDSDDSPYLPLSSRHQQPRAYEPVSHDTVSSVPPRKHQALNQRYFRQEPRYHPVSQQIQYQEPLDQSHHRSVPQQVIYPQPEDQSHHRSVPQQVIYPQPEDQSHHRSVPQQVIYHQPEDQSHQRSVPQQVIYHQPEDQSHYRSVPQRAAYHQPEDQSHYRSVPQRVAYHEPEDQSYHRSVPQHIEYNQPQDQTHHRNQDIAYHHVPQGHQTQRLSHDGPQHESYEVPRHEESYEESHEPEERDEDAKYSSSEEESPPAPKRSVPSYPTGRVQRDPRLPLYFTMYEKRVITDPLNKYGKGPWRYLTYGHGITYGSKEPGKVFEKGYGYIRALGRDHCKDAENLCPPKDDEPFQYEGRKEPYFGYRPH